MNSRNLLRMPLQAVPHKALVFSFVVALVGFADAVYLSIEHFRGVIPPCTVSGCEVVLSSSYATVLGIPVALFGVAYYLAILVGLMIYFDARNLKVLGYVLLLTTIGFIISLWLLFVQAFLIHSFCQYCLLSLTTSTLLFIASAIIFSKYRVPATLTE